VVKYLGSPGILLGHTAMSYDRWIPMFEDLYSEDGDNRFL